MMVTEMEKERDKWTGDRLFAVHFFSRRWGEGNQLNVLSFPKNSFNKSWLYF